MREMQSLGANQGKGKGLRIAYGDFLLLALLYLTVPVIIFFWGFLKLGWAFLFTAVTGVVMFMLIKEARQSEGGKRVLELKTGQIVFTVLATVFWAYICGIGEFVWAIQDHNVRYAMLNDLVNYDWPVFFDLSKQSDPEVREILGEGRVAFAYYFTYWMVPALTGKVFGLMFARVMTLLWSALGFALVILGISFMNKKYSCAIYFALFFFAGFDIIPFFYEEYFTDIVPTFEGWNYDLYIHGNFYQTMNVFNQTIPGWVVTVLVIDAVSNRYIGALASLMFCYSPWATIGLFPIAVCRLFDRKNERTPKNIITIGNIAVPLVMLICFVPFYTANAAATDIRAFIWESFATPGDLAIAYISFVIIEFGLWALLVFKDERKNPLFWVALAVLIIMPVYKMSRVNDLLMRGTLAPMFVLNTMVALKLCRAEKAVTTTDTGKKALAEKSKGQKTFLGIIGALFVSGLVPIILLATIISVTKDIYCGADEPQSKDDIVSFGDFAGPDWADLMDRQFFVHDYEETAFYKYIGRTK